MIKALSNTPESLVLETQEGELEIPAILLRQNCPCAKCKPLAAKTLKVLDYNPAEIKIITATVVGNYGVKIQFSDGHSFGIFTFEQLATLSKNVKNPERG